MWCTLYSFPLFFIQCFLYHLYDATLILTVHSVCFKAKTSHSLLCTVWYRGVWAGMAEKLEKDEWRMYANKSVSILNDH